MRGRDVARQRDDLFLPIFKPWDGAELATQIEVGHRTRPATWHERTENKVSRILLDVVRHKKGARAELPAIKPTVSEILSNPQNLTYHLLAYDADYPGYGYDDIIEYAHPVPELEALMRQAMVLHNQYRWDRSKTRVIEVGKLHDDDFVVVFYPRNDDVVQFIRRVKGGRRVQARRPAPAPATPPVNPYPAIDVRRRFAVMPRVEALAVYRGELVCTNDDLIRNTAYCWSPMTAKEIEEKTGIVERRYTELDLDHIALIAAQRALAKAGRRPEEIGAVLFCSCTSAKMMPSLATWLSGQPGMLQTHVSRVLVAAWARPPPRLPPDPRPLPGGEGPVRGGCRVRRSDQIGTVRTSRM